MNWYLVVKFLHITAVVTTVGGVFARELIRYHAMRAEDVQTFASFVRAAGKIDTAMIGRGMFAVLIFGIVLALIGGFPIFGFLQGASQNWLLAANILLLGIIVMVPMLLVPRGRKFEPILQAALAEGQITPELRIAMNVKVVRLAHLYEGFSLLVIMALMVTKPF